MERALIENQKWIYHLSSMKNLEGILTKGLISRYELASSGGQFEDIADHEILDGRAAFELDRHVPFHFFSNNPFDGRVQTTRRSESFFYICVSRERAKARGYKILPRHPLAKERPAIFDFSEGFEKVDWPRMNSRDYKDQETKLVCMAECLSPTTVPSNDFAKLVFCSEAHEKSAVSFARGNGINIETWTNQKFFMKRS